MSREITTEMMKQYENYLCEQEKSPATISKYMRDLRKLTDYVAGREMSKLIAIGYKDYLKNECSYKTASINSFIVAANRFYDFLGWYDLKTKTYKLQKEIYMPEDRELTKAEYKKLLQEAFSEGKTRVGMIIETICATGIRVSELSSITVLSVKNATATVNNKGKERRVLIPRNLQVRLLRYIRKNGIKGGQVFQTSGGKSVDRTWIWREMKKLCDQAGIKKEKVFPHNLRHLFARTFYMLNKDIAKLADILGHSNIETTRIYLKESMEEHRKQLDRLDLLVGEAYT